METGNTLTTGFTKQQVRLLAALAFANFGLRLAVVRPGRFQFADGIRLMDWRFAAESKAQPLYPALVSAVRTVAGDPILAGAIVASLFGAIAVFPLFLLARRLYGSAAGWWSVALYSALWSVYVQSAGVTANPLLVFSILVALLAFLRIAADAEDASAGPVIFWAGVAALVRPEGMLLWPLAAAALFLHVRRGRLVGAGLLASALPLAGWLAWNLGIGGGFLYGAELATGIDQATPGKFTDYLTAYVVDFSAGLFHVYTLAALAGVGLSIVAGPADPAQRHLLRTWNALLAYVLACLFVILGLHWAYVPRLLAPIQVLVLVPAGMALAVIAGEGRSWRGALRAAPVALLVALTVAASAAIVAGLARNLADIGQDIRAAAESLPAIAARSHALRVTSDLPVETAYYSGLGVEWYVRPDARVGDLVVLHNIRTNLEEEIAALGAGFDPQSLLEFSAPYISPREGGLPVVAQGVRMEDLSARKSPTVEEPYRTVVLRLRPRPSPDTAPPDASNAAEPSP